MTLYIYGDIFSLFVYAYDNTIWPLINKSDNLSLPVLFFFKIVLDALGPLHFHITFRISLSISIFKSLLAK